MSTIQWFGIGVLVLFVAIVVLFIRRALMARVSGTIKLNVRLSTLVDGRGWSAGFGRFVGDELRWYRMFSFALRPKRVLSRRGLAVESRRSPRGQERLALPADWVILRCTSHHAPVEIAMAESTVTGFSSWLEASLPGGDSSRLAA
ncbi:DUF2550 domain-containing protein [Solwaraspora sp. WMMB335]|uniref:DUF2550 domain-containing protein n=1 Tax=Solwaraspora sp. WMMB335 TaxID=3404118 RepID=UPI003B936C6B